MSRTTNGFEASYRYQKGLFTVRSCRMLTDCYCKHPGRDASKIKLRTRGEPQKLIWLKRILEMVCGHSLDQNFGYCPLSQAKKSTAF